MLIKNASLTRQATSKVLFSRCQMFDSVIRLVLVANLTRSDTTPVHCNNTFIEHSPISSYKRTVFSYHYTIKPNMAWPIAGYENMHKLNLAIVFPCFLWRDVRFYSITDQVSSYFSLATSITRKRRACISLSSKHQPLFQAPAGTALNCYQL